MQIDILDALEKLPLELRVKYGYHRLTHAEKRVIGFLSLDLRPKQIASELNNSVHTINSHIGNIKDKLGCNTAYQLGNKLGVLQSMH